MNIWEFIFVAWVFLNGSWDRKKDKVLSIWTWLFLRWCLITLIWFYTASTRRDRLSLMYKCMQMQREGESRVSKMLKNIWKLNAYLPAHVDWNWNGQKRLDLKLLKLLIDKSQSFFCAFIKLCRNYGRIDLNSAITNNIGNTRQWIFYFRIIDSKNVWLLLIILHLADIVWAVIVFNW